MDVLVGIPLYNEEESVHPLLTRLDELHQTAPFPVRLLLVDDGSKDQTLPIIQRYAANRDWVQVLPHGINRGLGAAIQTILGYAAEQSPVDGLLSTLDGDNTHDPLLIIPMVEQLERERLDIVIASRFVPGAKEIGLSPQRKLFSRGASLIFRTLVRIPGVKDYSCGFRVYRIAFLRRAIAKWGRLVTVNGFECMAEILAKCSRLRPKVGEHPLVLRYDQKGGPSKMRVVRTIMGYLGVLLANT